jgi:maleylpyruvate isomerase
VRRTRKSVATALARFYGPLMILYGFWRSSATWRVRIALAHKGLEYELRPVNIWPDSGEQHRPEYRARNPLGQVPLLELADDGRQLRLAQSMAILEYLEERWPSPSLLPSDRVGRARARQIAEMINSGIQPLQNTSILEYLREVGHDDSEWVRRWVPRGLAAVEAVVADGAGRFCVGDAVTFADVCLVPQVEFARRFDIDLTRYPTLVRIAATCAGLDAFERAHAKRQPDAGRS